MLLTGVLAVAVLLLLLLVGTKLADDARTGVHWGKTCLVTDAPTGVVD
jgi:hypothetical protein